MRKKDFRKRDGGEETEKRKGDENPSRGKPMGFKQFIEAYFPNIDSSTLRPRQGGQKGPGV